MNGSLKFSKKIVREIMTPITQTKILKINYNIKKCIKKIIKYKKSILPVLNKDKNNLLGFLKIKKLFFCMQKKNKKVKLKKILNKPNIIPESKKAIKILKQFINKNYEISMIIDEFGNFSGIITKQDILNLITSNLYKQKNFKYIEKFQQLTKKTFLINANMKIKNFNLIFKSNFYDQHVDTIGGFIIKKFGTIPSTKDNIEIEKYKFIVYSSNNLKIKNIHLTLPKHIFYKNKTKIIL